MVLYRGCLKSCNYSCSYCPFSKHQTSERELRKDKEQWSLFCQSLLERKEILNIHALMVVPYGEALIHSWYWEGFGNLTGTEFIEAVGAQTNLSFSIETSLRIYREAGGQTDKLRLWATFHPEMISVEEFIEKCCHIKEAGIPLSVGAVGNPENLTIIRKLRDRLPEEIYLWLNKMEGLRRFYTEKEKEEFQAIDPFFFRELVPVPGNTNQCKERLFIEGDGKLRGCNISPLLKQDWYKNWETVFDTPPECRRKICSCYLAYAGRQDVINKVLFGKYPLFRISIKPKAAFLDIDGTLIPKGELEIPEYTLVGLKALAELGKTLLFFATSLPIKEAYRRCQKAWSLFQGGVFAGGAHVVVKSSQSKREAFSYLNRTCLSLVKQYQKSLHYRILIYGTKENIYKITLVRPRSLPWKEDQVQMLIEECRKQRIGKPLVHSFVEGHCLELIADGIDKAGGVKKICHWLGISPAEVVAVGDSKEDERMIAICGMGYHC